MPRPSRAPFALLLVALIAASGCGGADGGEQPRAGERPARTRLPGPGLCAGLSVSVTGRLGDPAADELSGLAASRRQRGVLWAIEDSGNPPDIIALRANGSELGRFAVTGADNVDWEEVAVAGSDVYAADIGDNAEARSGITIYRVPEPDVRAGGGATRPSTRIDLRYPDGPHDAEALLVDPRTRTLIVFTKDLAGIVTVYAGRGGTLRRIARRDLGIGEAVTAAGIAPDGRTVAMRTYDAVFGWTRAPGEPLTRTVRRPPCRSPTPLDEGQGEALTVLRGGRSFLTVTEGRNPPVRRYEAR